MATGESAPLLPAPQASATRLGKGRRRTDCRVARSKTNRRQRSVAARRAGCTPVSTISLHPVAQSCSEASGIRSDLLSQLVLPEANKRQNTIQRSAAALALAHSLPALGIDRRCNHPCKEQPMGRLRRRNSPLQSHRGRQEPEPDPDQTCRKSRRNSLGIGRGSALRPRLRTVRQSLQPSSCWASPSTANPRGGGRYRDTARGADKLAVRGRSRASHAKRRSARWKGSSGGFYAPRPNALGSLHSNSAEDAWRAIMGTPG